MGRLRCLVACAATAVGAEMFLGFAGWPLPQQILEVSGLILAAILTSALATQRSTTRDWATMPPSFVIDFTSLLLFGPEAMMLVATAGMVAQRLADLPRSFPPSRILLNAAATMLATLAAGVAH